MTMTRTRYKLGFASVFVLSVFWFLFVNHTRSPKYADQAFVSENSEIHKSSITQRNSTDLLTNITENLTNMITNSIKKIINQEIRLNSKLWPKEMTSKDLTWRLRNTRRNFQAMNTYKVKSMIQLNQNHSAQEILCHLKNRVNISTLMASDLPLNGNSRSQDLPKKGLQEDIGKLGRCAVVTSAASMTFSKLGQEIGEPCHDSISQLPEARQNCSIS